MLDVILAPDFSTSGTIYFSFMEEDTKVVREGRAKDDPAFEPQRMSAARARLVVGTGAAAGTAKLEDLKIVFNQVPWIVAYSGSGEPGGRMAFSPDGKYLFLSSGDRQELVKEVLFRLDNNLGKIIRLFPDGSVPADNPFVSTAGARPEIWSLGLRNTYGLAFAPDGTLWSSDMGPMGGDEVNIIRPGVNYGWPAVSNGSHYGGVAITPHATGDGFEAPQFWWNPVIAPAAMIFYKGPLFTDWSGSAILAGLQAQGLVRVSMTGTSAVEVQRILFQTRIRDVVEGPGGELWVLTDGTAGKLIPITPEFPPPTPTPTPTPGATPKV